MKVRRTIYVILGILCLALQLLAYVRAFAAGGVTAGETRHDPGYVVALYFGFNIALWLSILCWVGVYRVSRKLKRKERERLDLLRSFDDAS